MDNSNHNNNLVNISYNMMKLMKNYLHMGWKWHSNVVNMSYNMMNLFYRYEDEVNEKLPPNGVKITGDLDMLWYTLKNRHALIDASDAISKIV